MISILESNDNKIGFINWKETFLIYMNFKDHFKQISNDVQSEAMINELKGNLFEYSVANGIAQHYNLENLFLNQLSKQFYLQLKLYEKTLSDLDNLCLKALPVLSGKIIHEMVNYLNGKSLQIKNVNLVGKLVHGGSRESLKESDIVLTTSCDQKLYVSIKLCKSGAYVNTKSGGVKSFLKNYFSPFSNSLTDQENINHFISFEYANLAKDFYDYYELDFKGKFDKAWEENDLPSLPGELPKILQERLRAFYSELIKKYFMAIEGYYRDSPELFLGSLHNLLGAGRSDILQFTLFHKGNQHNDRYVFDKVSFIDRDKLNSELDVISLDPPIENKSSFLIKLKSSHLQIRIKPMNKFTVPGFKVNCSTKYF